MWVFTVADTNNSFTGTVLYSAGAPTTGSVSINYSLPIPSSDPSGVGDPLVGIAPLLPPFCASGSYTYTGQNTANVVLQLLDQNGKIIGTSAPAGVAGQAINLPATQNGPGTWGAGCGSAKGKSQLIYIPDDLPMPDFGITPSTPYNQQFGPLKLQAVLVDSVTLKQLATGAPILYPVEPGVAATKMQLVLYDAVAKKVVQVIPTATPIPLSEGRSLEDILNIIYNLYRPGAAANNPILCVDVTLSSDVSESLNASYSGPSLNANITAVDQSGNNSPVESTTTLLKVTKGADIEYFFHIAPIVPVGSVTATIQPYVTFAGGSYSANLSPTSLKFETISVTATPAPNPPNCNQPGSCLIQGSSPNTSSANTIQVVGKVTAGASGEFVVRTLSTTDKAGKTVATTMSFPKFAAAPGVPTPFQDTIQVPVPYNPSSVYITYYLLHAGQSATDYETCSARCADKFLSYSSFTSNLTTPKGSGGSAPGPNMALNNVSDTKGHGPITAASSDDDFVSSLHDSLSKVKELARARVRSNSHAPQPHATPSNPPLIGIAATWTFNPPIPSDGSFSAAISFNYASSQLPDDPNFVESKLQVVSIDSTGTLHTYQTTVDTTNKIATAQITDLDPTYSLALVGPFSQTPVMLATVPTSSALVNTGTQATDLSTTAYLSSGVGTPAVSVLNAGNQIVSTGPGWVQAWSNPSTLAGVSWFDNGAQFAVMPGTTTDFSFIFTDVEYNATTSTEIDLTNTSLFDSNITVTLLGADGSTQGTYTTLLPAKNSISGRVEGFFPTLATGFTGYLTVTSEQTLAASGIRWSGATATGLVAQPVNNTSFAITSAYYPQLASGVTTTVHLVNASTSAANVTLKAWSASGSAAAPTVKMQLASGQQYTGAVATIFGTDPAGSIEVDSDTPGVFGDVLTMDASFFPNFAVSLPLSGTPVATSVLPYATTSTTAYVFNPNSSAATVTVTPYGADGTKGAASSMSVPANGRAAIGVSASAYATISSTQPVVAAGWMVVPSGTTTGYLSLPATFSASTGGSTAPINGGGTTIEFGNVAVGSSATGTLTIYNTGTTTQTISTITASDPQFTIVSPARPFNIAAGSQQAITIQFAPTSTGEQSALLTITAGGSATLYAPVVLLGVGTPQPSGGFIEFGNVQVGSSTTGTFTVTNTGSASVNVTAIASTDPEFTVVSPSLPFTIASGAQQVITIQFLPASADDHTATLTLTANGSTTLFPPVTLDGTGTASTGTGPTPVISSVVNGASFVAKLARGSWGTIQGTFTAAQLTATGVLTLPTSQGGASVTVGGVPAPIYYTQSGQVNFLVPQETALGSAVPVVLTVGGTPSAAMTVPIADYAVGVFQYARTATIVDPIIVHLNNSIVTPTNPAVPAETLVIYANGIGKLNNPPATGALSPSSPAAAAVDTPVITVGGAAVNVLFAGLTPALFGLVQLNITLPASLPTGALPVVIQSPGDSSAPVNLYVQGNAGTAAPKLGVAGTLSFASVTVGQSSSLTLTISNSGNAALNVSSITSSNAAFTAGANAFTVQAGSSFGVTVKFSPASAGPQSGTLTIASNDPSNGSLGIPLSGTGTAVAPPPAPSITTSVTQLAFGSVTVGKTQAMPVTINNAGNAALTVTSISIDNKLFTPSVTSFTGAAGIAAGGSSTLSVQFAPTAAGPQSGTLTLSTNDPAHASVAIALTGTGVAAAPTNVTLSVDGGTFNNSVGFSGVANATFVNRLTPPSYPATLTGLQIYFGNRANGLNPNAPITLVVITNPSGSSEVNTGSAGLENFYTSTVGAQGVFNIYNLPTGVTISSGDFVVGFAVPNPAGLFPADEDQVTPSQGRSYTSTNGTGFQVIDSFGASLAGNFGIRAAVTLGGSSTSSVVVSPAGPSGQVRDQ